MNIRTVRQDLCGVAILEAAAEAGLPTSAFNAGHTVTNGAGWFQINSGADNTRMSSSHAYLHPIIDSRPNLEIRTHCWASKVVFDEQRRATGVDYLSPDLLTHTTVTARREVVLSAGAIDTPKLLMLSGIGPGEHLQEFAVDVLVDAQIRRPNLGRRSGGLDTDAKLPMIPSAIWWGIWASRLGADGLDIAFDDVARISVPLTGCAGRIPDDQGGFCLTPNVCRGRWRSRLRSFYRDRARVDCAGDPKGDGRWVYGVRLARKISRPAMADWSRPRAAPARRAVRRQRSSTASQDPQHRLPHRARCRMVSTAPRPTVLDPASVRAASEIYA